MTTGAPTQTTTTTTTTTRNALASISLETTTDTTKTGGCCKKSSCFNRDTAIENQPRKQLQRSGESDVKAMEKEATPLTGDKGRNIKKSCCPGSCKMPDSPSSKDEKIRESVSEYYRNLSGTGDLKTKACCADASEIPQNIQRIMDMIPGEVLSTSYGCGFPFPLENAAGLTALDLGCGTGMGCYILSGLVGENGHVIGLDMTQKQLNVAIRNELEMTNRLGYSKSNMEFKAGTIENLETAGIKNNSIDLATSNCVINLSPDKASVYSESMRVLTPGGKFYISDVFSDKDMPEQLKEDKELRGECLGGAITVDHFHELLKNVATPEYRAEVKVISSKTTDINNPKTEEKIGDIKFESLTIVVTKVKNNSQELE